MKFQKSCFNMVRSSLAIILTIKVSRMIANRNESTSCYHLSFLDNLENGYLIKKGVLRLEN